MHWYLDVLKKYAVFSGRARRSEYWYFVLFSAIVSLLLAILDGVVGSFSSGAGMGVLGGLYSLGVLIPSLAVTVRRLHDRSRSGWWLLIGLIPLIGSIVILIFLVQDSVPEDNSYGANPKAIDV